LFPLLLIVTFVTCHHPCCSSSPSMLIVGFLFIVTFVSCHDLLTHPQLLKGPKWGPK
jgi:hypothetical protein